jgi:hypothetical protein
MANAALNEAVRRIRQGDRAGGKELLVELLKAEPENDQAWLWMAAAVEEDTLRRECLEEALKHNPDNQEARRALQKLAGGGPPAAPLTRGAGASWLRRRRRYGPAGPGCLAVLLLLAAALVVVASVGLRREARLRDEGVVAQAGLTEAWTSKEEAGTVYWVRYAFTAADGRTYTASDFFRRDLPVELDAGTWNEAVSNATLPVIYVPGAPRLNRPEAVEAGGNPWLYVAIGGAIVAVLLAIILFIFGIPTYRDVLGIEA